MLKMQLNANDVFSLIRNEVLKLTESTLDELEAIDHAGEELTLMHRDSREKFTIGGLDKSSGKIDNATLITSTGEPLNVTRKELGNYILPKNADDSNDDEQINGDKENEE
jgi:hypothetical protein